MKKYQALFFCLFLFISAFPASQASGLELSIPSVKADAGKVVELPVRLDRVEGLAGVKIVLSYDPEVLTFKDAAKTKVTASLMHIVNDKKPGSLIVVMAGAKGIGGENISILTLTFRISSDAEGKNANLKILEYQLMSDQLKEFKAAIKVSPLIISSPSSSSAGRLSGEAG